ncbi:hypothetical protein PVAG01_09607 [Phlyctema vagabunda]|uniref:Uncharacterized protein n=1 Tax=Phlyctema vagabunda TaxID=108571 RepID=A0ABR4P7X1_9HELO
MLKRPLPKTAPQHLRSTSTSTNSSRRDSSLQKVWAEDYYADDYAGALENRFEQTSAPSPPAPAVLTTRPFSRSIPSSSEEEYPVQRSLTALLPFRPRADTQTSPQRSPVRDRYDFDIMSTTGDKDRAIRVTEKSKGGISSWFSGSSAPVSVGIPPTDDDSTPPASPTSESSTRPTLARIDSSLGAQSKPGSRFPFFGPKPPPTPKTVQIPAAMGDEFISLDIESALFPSGAPSDRDPFSPASFKNLLMNAEGLLFKLQTAYKIRTLSLHEITAEKEEKTEQLEESEMRVKHLKMQLEDMGHKLQAQDLSIAELSCDLAREKQARAAEKEAREKSIALVKFSREEMGMMAAQPQDEDLGISIARQQQWRKSTLSAYTNTEGESDVDDDMSGGGESVFSRSISPTIIDSSATSIMTLESTPELMQASFGRVVPNQNPPSGRPKPTAQASTFQKILKGISASEQPQAANTNEETGGIGLENGCNNCRGKDTSVAWDAVGLLRAENKGLKDRVEELEVAVDDAMNVCTSLGLRRE